MRGSRDGRGFTIVELLVVIVVIAILSSIGIAVYARVQKRSDNSRILASVNQVKKILEVHNAHNNDYPPNLAGVQYVPPESIAFVLYTNAPQKRTHPNLTPDQNAQLLLNSCNAHMPVVHDGTTYNTGCKFSGNNFHIKGRASSNVVLKGPTVAESEFQMTCGVSCGHADQAIVADFVSQGGYFPITVPKGNVEIPSSELISYGTSSEYCLQASSLMHDGIVYHTTNEDDGALIGLCPENPSLHYP